MPNALYDMSEPILRGQQYRANKLSLDTAESKNRNAANILAQRNKASTGDPEELRKLMVMSPEDAQGVAQAIGAINKMKPEEVKQTKERAQMLNGFATWADTPEKWKQGVEFLKKQNVDVGAFEEYSEHSRALLFATTNKLAGEADKKINEVYGEPTQLPGQPHLIGQPVTKEGQGGVEWKGVRDNPQNPAPPKTAGLTMQFDPETGRPLSVSQGGPAGQVNAVPDKTVSREAQQDIVSKTDALDRIASIRKLVDPEFLTYWGKLKAEGSAILEKAGVEPDAKTKEFIHKRQMFTNLVQRDFNAYRKDITGAAAAVAELEQLMKSTINVNQSPTEFQGSLDLYEQETKRALRLKQKILREGIPLGSKSFGQRHDSLWFAGADDDPDVRGAELERKGLNEAQIIKQLQAEGYAS